MPLALVAKKAMPLALVAFGVRRYIRHDVFLFFIFRSYEKGIDSYELSVPEIT